MEFKADEAKNSFLALDFVYNKNFPLKADISSIGAYYPPMFIYLLSIPFLFSKNPVVAGIYIALFNIAAVYLCLLFCKNFFNERIALMATALFSVNPWSILYSRKIWSQELLPLFVILFFYALYKLIVTQEYKLKYLLLSCICLAIVTQLHLSTLPYIVLLVIVFIIFKPSIKPLHYIVGLAVFSALYLPYILYEISNRFSDLHIFLRVLELVRIINLKSFVIPFILSTSLGFKCSNSVSILSVIHILLLIGAIMHLLCHIRDKRYVVLLLWFFIPPLFLSFSHLPLPYHYFICVFPVQFIMMGIFLDTMSKRFENRKIFFRYFPLAIISLLVSYQFLCWASFNTYVKNHNYVSWMGYGPPFRYRVEEIRQLMVQGYINPEIIHKRILENKPKELSYKYDFLATKYIVENIGSISN